MKTKLLVLLCSLGLFLVTQVRADTGTSTLTVQIGVTMKSGDTKPIVNTVVRLLKNQVKIGALTPHCDWEKIMADFNKSIEDNTVYTSTTDFLGKAIFENAKDGFYYVFCEAKIGANPRRHSIYYEKPVLIREKSFVALSNDDFLD